MGDKWDKGRNYFPQKWLSALGTELATKSKKSQQTKKKHIFSALFRVLLVTPRKAC